MTSFPKLAQFKSPAALQDRLRQLNLDLPLDKEVLTSAASPLAAPYMLGNRVIGNRWCIQPMEGWDAHPDGTPSELVFRRWQNFGRSGAKLIWGGEAAAVQPAGRANPRQLLATPAHLSGLRRLRLELLAAHEQAGHSPDDSYVGLQLTHSGRFSRPNSTQLEPKIACRHPILDAKFGIDSANDRLIWKDAELEQLVVDYVLAAQTADAAGFDFVDIKACHGYCLHEFLGARRRPGDYGGDLAGRCRLLLKIIDNVKAAAPRLGLGVRLSLFDLIPFEAGPGSGQPVPHAQLLPYEWGFGVNPDNPLEYDLTEPLRLINWLMERQVSLVNLSAGSAYYNPHILRPASYPPSDGYLPPEDPLVGVARQITATRICKERFPQLLCVGSGYSYLQEYLPHVAQGVVRAGWADFVGLGRMVLSYPTLPQDVLGGGNLVRKQICRTFSDCTTAARLHIESGCYPLDPFYKNLPQAERVAAARPRDATV
ncbi:MAG: NADH:flavin oxidoreductase [Pirellulales bacterium]|nr:NADH:flavin oxidoreductase [Pirellulales bacterium]